MAKQKAVPPETMEEGLEILKTRISNWKNNPGNTTLSLKGLKLDHIPDEVFELKGIRFLSIGMNPISSLPERFKELTNLRHFNATRCLFKEIPPILFELRELELINLTGNQIETIPDEIEQLSNLKTLTIGSNKISAVPESITRVTALTSIDLANNQIKNLPGGMIDLFNLRTLVLTGNPIQLLEGNKKINVTGKNAVVPVLRHFMSLSRRSTNDSGKFHSHFEFAKELKTAFFQYLIYFNSFVEKTKGKVFDLEVSSDDTGLTISGQVTDKEFIQIYLIEFVGFIKEKVELIDPVFERSLTSNERELVMIELRNQVRHLSSQIELRNLENKMLTGEVNRLMRIIEFDKSHPQPILINAVSNSNSTATASANLDLKIAIPDLQNILFELKNALDSTLSNVQKEELNAIDAELLSIDENADATTVNKTPFKRLRRILDQINNPESEWSKALSGTKKGVELLQVLGRKYNIVAPWLALPSIPDLLVGKDK
ncbi:leucine-rich repeat domain-containing protein [Pedobacter deserti]|uniref:leucine-rich repeat domain-containing protein n=1 Tax=Pedobacter deserti TaxID=2817382 RepID=UPI00210C2DED|nr:leucine-rich repeat domain-containing protein [Pedobacter sp. SYSU D00382]